MIRTWAASLLLGPTPTRRPTAGSGCIYKRVRIGLLRLETLIQKGFYGKCTTDCKEERNATAAAGEMCGTLWGPRMQITELMEWNGLSCSARVVAEDAAGCCCNSFEVSQLFVAKNRGWTRMAMVLLIIHIWICQ